jgi:hypothetical protein
VKLAPHPAWRRLFANGAAPALTVERLTQAGLKLERLASKSPLPQWLFAPSLETLLRSIDLSGIESKALAIAHNRAANEMTRAAVLRRVREHVESPRNDIGVAAAAAPEQPSHPSARDVGEIAAILRRYGSEAVVEPSGSLEIAPAAVATVAGRSRSSAPLTITRADAAASLLRLRRRPGAAADSASTGEGPRGLAARVSRRVARSLSVEGARSAPDLEDFADRLDQLLRREARRNGIDLEEIDR